MATYSNGQLTVTSYEAEYIRDFLTEVGLLIEEDDGTFFPIQLCDDYANITKILSGESVDTYL